MAFRSLQNGVLVLALDEAYRVNFTQKTNASIKLELSSLLGDISININIEKLDSSSFASIEKQQEEQKKNQQQADFCNDSMVKKIETIFEVKVDINSIRRKNV